MTPSTLPEPATTTFTPIQDVLTDSMEGKEVTVRGWIYRKRNQGALIFAVVRDSTDIVQCAVKKDRVGEHAFTSADKVLIEGSVIVKGVVKKDARAPTGYELQATGFEVISSAEAFPIAKDNSPEWLLDIRHLSLRSRDLTASWKIKDTMLGATRHFFEKEGYYQYTPPELVSGACEGGSTLFELDYFGQKAFLSQSAQLYSEAMIYSLEKVYAISTSFRAEKSRTVRHLAEYTHIEPEAAFVDVEGMMRVAEQYVTAMAHAVATKNAKDLKLLGRDPADLLAIKAPFERLTYEEALAEVNKKGGKMEWGDDFGAEDEKILMLERKSPTFVTGYPKEVKAFYMKEDPKDPRKVLNFDLLGPEGHGEIIGGSQREDDVEKLISRLRGVGSKPEDYAWYIDLRKYGSVPHSGFGLGLERVLKWFCKFEHIRDTIPFPRTINRVYP